MSEEHLDYGQFHVFSSGVEVVILPFPSLQFEKFIKQGNKKFPLPKPPKKIVSAAVGAEEMDDLEDEDYLAKKQVAETNQERWLSEKILTVCLRDCIQINLDDYQDIIAELKEEDEDWPKTALKQKVAFLSAIALRSAGDFQALTRISTKLMGVGEGEVSEQLETFPSDVQEHPGDETDTSGSVEVERVEVQSKS